MENKVRLKSVFSIARIEYIKWITDPRVIIVGVLLVFMRTLITEPLLKWAGNMGEAIRIFEPFIAVGNSPVLILLIPCVFLILISDYPVWEGNVLFFISRTGKKNWFWGQVLFLICAISTYLLVIFFVSTLTSGGEAGVTWSNVVTKYLSYFPNENGNFTSQLLPSNLYNQIPMITALVQTFFLMAAYLFVLALVLYYFRMRHLRTAGFFAVIMVIAVGMVTYYFGENIMWAFPMANTLVWLHYTKILSKAVVPVWFSFLYFVILISLLLVANLAALKKLQFVNMEQLR